MHYQIMEQRLNNVLQQDKCSDIENVCRILKGELSPIIRNYIELNSSIDVRAQRVGDKLKFLVEVDATRIRPFGYLPKNNI